MKKRKGISLIVLIITIIVVIILATIIILSFNRNNPIEKANQAKFKSDVSSLDPKIKALNSDYFNGGDTGNTSCYSWKAVSYMLDKDIWQEFAKGTGADFAVGGPSLELLFNSYCAKNSTNNCKAQAFGSEGYRVSKDGGNSWMEGDGNFINSSDSLYCTTDTGANSLWLASPSRNSTGDLYYLTNKGVINHTNYTAPTYGFRPVVCLKSNVLIKDVAGGVEIYE